MSTWYIAHDDELLMDLDACKRRHPSGRTYGELYFAHRLLDAEQQGLLELHDFGTFLVPSATIGHYHAYVRLRRSLPLLERLAWQAWLGGDWMRSRADFMRLGRGIQFPSILEEVEPIRGFYRRPDAVCQCAGKHRSEDYPDCAVWRELRGASVWDLFGKWDKPENLPALPLGEGRLPLDRFRRIREKRKSAENVA